MSFLLIKASFAQRDTSVFYMKDESTVANKGEAKFMRVIISPDANVNKDLSYIIDYYLNVKIKMIATSYTKSVLFQDKVDGLYLEYFPNGNKKCEKYFKKGTSVGREQHFYSDGKLLSSVNYDINPLGYIETCNDSTGRALIEHGNGKYTLYDQTLNTITAEGNVLNGLKTGIWTESLATGENYIAVYEKGVKISAGKTLATQVNIKPGSFNVEVAPEFPGGIEHFYAFLAKTIHYPYLDSKNNVQGRVIVAFMIEKDGTLSNVEALRGPDISLQSEAVRAIKLSPPWNPGTQNGIPVRVQYTVPVMFALAGAN
jgi:TonB family protein